MDASPGRVLILGAGPTGLGAAYRLQELGHKEYLVLEATSRPGGLASSRIDNHGFTWDLGGHVQFSHYAYYDEVLDRALGEQWLYHERESWIWLKDRFIPYPFQNNLHRLGKDDRKRAWEGLVKAAHTEHDSLENFLDWIRASFGPGISQLFLVPYNRKVWGYPLESLGTGWIGERVAVPDLARIRENMLQKRDDVSWGPNSQFRFPAAGGTGAIWKAVSDLLPSGVLNLKSEAVEIDVSKKRVLLKDGRRFRYDSLISSVPLDTLCQMSRGLPEEYLEASKELVYSTCHVLGIGLKGGQPPDLQKKCWMYFPGDRSPYYRVTVFSNYSPANVPKGKGFWSLMAEVCETPFRPVDRSSLKAQVLASLERDGLITAESKVASFWKKRVLHGYPTPFRGREAVLRYLLPGLEEQQIYSRGRFGAWRYEVSNQDHSFMQGVEVVNRLYGIDREYTLSQPDYVNSGAFAKKPSS